MTRSFGKCFKDLEFWENLRLDLLICIGRVVPDVPTPISNPRPNAEYWDSCNTRSSIENETKLLIKSFAIVSKSNLSTLSLYCLKIMK